MSSSRIVATAALLICLICPILEVFDYWDHTARTGNDTEYIFVILALCVGIAYAKARLVINRPACRFALTIRLSSARKAFSSNALVSIPEIATSPPALSLRM